MVQWESLFWASHYKSLTPPVIRSESGNFSPLQESIMSKMKQLAALGQAIWLDYIRRSFLEDGSLQALIDRGLRGMTSNPTIFEKAIAGSNDYDRSMEFLVLEGKSTGEIYTALTVEDIQMAADLLRPVYDANHGQDGFVSLEVDPTLARDTQGTVEEAQRLWQLVNRPNLMIKIPATEAGLPAIRQTISAGINVNVTLIFSISRYAAVMDAYLSGLEQRIQDGLPVDQIASVASFFVSRMDSKVDQRLEMLMKEEGPQATRAAELQGQIAVANTRLAYQEFKKVFSSSRFTSLQSQDAKMQRPLWASTSTKNPAYSDIKYVQELIARDTVNTLPQDTLEEFEDHGIIQLTIEDGLEAAHQALKTLEDLGISLRQVTDELEDEGVSSFAQSFESLLETIDTKRRRIIASPTFLAASLRSFQKEDAIAQALKEMERDRIMPRIWEHDHTVWKLEPDEITNRLGWMNIMQEMRSAIPVIGSLVAKVQAEGYTQGLLMGMGGSSLAPELFNKIFGEQEGFLDLSVIDSTTPQAVLDQLHALDLAHTLFIVSTKSGTTEETLSFFRFFYNQVVASIGSQKAGEHFIAITDPGSKLVNLAEKYHFRAIFENNPNIGGRYSALSYFGLVPAALSGVDLLQLLDRAEAMAEACGPQAAPDENPAALLGAVLGEYARLGRDKLTMVLDPSIASFGDWVEQLIAESTGKEGRGILPVVAEPAVEPGLYGRDRLFVRIGQSPEPFNQDALKALGHPVVPIELGDLYDLGGQFFLWELATAVAGYRLGIQPFDQPNVEAAKQAARKMVTAYSESGELPREDAALTDGDIQVYGPVAASSAPGALQTFLEQGKPGDYISLQAFITPTQETTAALEHLRAKLLERYQLATTSGYGPRFLHSTGQLHKGDGGNGLFIQFTSDPVEEVPIPLEAGKDDSALSFGILALAQALGDRQALIEAGRRVIRFHLGQQPAKNIRKLSGD
jgi:transaldolase / glucose-6-phosphate isomerase